MAKIPPLWQMEKGVADGGYRGGSSRWGLAAFGAGDVSSEEEPEGGGGEYDYVGEDDQEALKGVGVSAGAQGLRRLGVAREHPLDDVSVEETFVDFLKGVVDGQNGGKNYPFHYQVAEGKADAGGAGLGENG